MSGERDPRWDADFEEARAELRRVLRRLRQRGLNTDATAGAFLDVGFATLIRRHGNRRLACALSTTVANLRREPPANLWDVPPEGSA